MRPLLIVLIAALLPAATAVADTKERIDAGVERALQWLEETRETQRLVKRAHAVLIFPDVIEMGFGVGGEFGEGALVEDGRITRPVKGATLIGNGPDAMNRVSMVGNDLKLDAGVGVCGKEGQSVPVGVGQPTLRIDGLTVGGTERS